VGTGAHQGARDVNPRAPPVPKGMIDQRIYNIIIYLRSGVLLQDT
jgi:hypothetical protein